MLWGFALWAAWATASPYYSDKSVFICLSLVHVDGWSDKSTFFSSLFLYLSFSFNLRSILKADQTNLSLSSSFCFCVYFNLCSILKADQTNLSLSFCFCVCFNFCSILKADQTNISLSFCFCVCFSLCSILKADQKSLSVFLCLSPTEPLVHTERWSNNSFCLSLLVCPPPPPTPSVNIVCVLKCAMPDNSGMAACVIYGTYAWTLLVHYLFV